MSAKVLVTGANGFIGRRVCIELIKQGFRVRAAVRESSRAATLPGEAVITGPIGPETDWTSAVVGVDTIVHLAARVHVMKEAAADPLAEFRAVNVLGTRGLARAASEHRVRRFVYVSSIKVNGEATEHSSFTENDQPRPQDPYGISKWEAEQALRIVGRETGLEIVIVRPPLVYGPNVGGNFLRLLKLLRSGVPLPLASLENRRSMIFSQNLADALVACAVHPAAAGKTYLVSDGEDLSTRDLIRHLSSLMGRPARLWPFPPPLLRLAGRMLGKAAELDRLLGSLQVDSAPIREELSWAPPYTVAEGLSATVQWFLASETSRTQKDSARRTWT